jgi:hypothetical protein
MCGSGVRVVCVWGLSGPFLLHWVAASASPAPPMTLAFLFRAVLPVLHRHSPFLRSPPNLSSDVFYC